jgi:hypothetical protein
MSPYPRPMTDGNTFDPHLKCPTCTDTPRYPSRPVGSGALATCLHCGARFVIHESGSELVGPSLGPEELAKRRAEATGGAV